MSATGSVVESPVLESKSVSCPQSLSQSPSLCHQRRFQVQSESSLCYLSLSPSPKTPVFESKCKFESPKKSPSGDLSLSPGSDSSVFESESKSTKKILSQGIII